MTIGKRISDLRRAHSYSQEYVAEKLGVSRQAVSKWETDTAAPDTYNLIALAELFGVSVEYIAIGKKEIAEDCTPQARNIAQEGMTAQKIVGFISLGVGLLSLVLGALLSALLILLAVYLIVGGVLCLTVRKRLWFVLMWTFLIMTLLWTSVLTGINVLRVFVSATYTDGATVVSFLSIALFIWLVAAVAISVVLFIKKKKQK